MDETAESELTREDLIHDLNNVFETITEAADLLSTDRRWKSLAATLGRSVMRGKRLLGAIPRQHALSGGHRRRRHSIGDRLLHRRAQTAPAFRARDC